MVEVNDMGLLNTFNEWRTTRYENRISQMREVNKCPDCNGRGFLTYPATEYAFYGNLDCPGCNGSGLFTAWDEIVE